MLQNEIKETENQRVDDLIVVQNDKEFSCRQKFSFRQKLVVDENSD